MNMTVTYALKPVEEGTELTYAMGHEMSYLERFGKGHLEKSIEKSLNNLKSILEK